MARFNYQDLIRIWRKVGAVFLAFCWLSGILCGIAAYLSVGSHILSLMRGSLYASVSIVGLLSITCLPFLFSAFAVYISKPILLLPISFAKGFAFSFISLGLLQCFETAGWLLRLLLMFSSIAGTPVLYWYWYRHISGKRMFSPVYTLFAASLLVLIGSIDFCCVSPFLAQLINS